MASLNNGDIDWLWGSLKPWQILHSTLAEKERCGSVQLDVWELVHETLGASTPDLAREDEGQEAGDGGRSHGMQFLGDDGDFWRPGGVMESRVREWLARRDEEDAISHALQLSAAPAPPHRHHLLHKCNTEQQLAISSSTISDQCSAAAISIAWEAAVAAADFDQNSCADHDHEGDQAAEDEEDGGADDLQDDTEEEEEEEEEEEDDDEDDDEDNLNYMQIISRDDHNYTLISSNHQLNHDYSEISREVFVLNQCYKTSAAIAAAAGGDQEAGRRIFMKAAKLAEGMEEPPDVEEVMESIEVCAVCLEKLSQYYNEGGGVQALACGHAFHTLCISPWLQRQPLHACCPCCRAPISTSNLAPPLHLEAPALHLEAAAADDHRGFACAGHGEQQQLRAISHDIMGLLADMEAALDRLGFRS